MPQNPVKSDLFVSKIVAGANVAVTPSNGTGIVTVAVTNADLDALLASPPAIGGTAPNAITGTTVTAATSLVLDGSTSGTTTIEAEATAAGTLTAPAVTGTLASTSGSDLYIADVYRCTAAQTANTNIVPANITGLSGAVAVGTYRFRAALYCTVASGTAGIAINQNLTTAVLGVCNFVATGILAAGVASQATTTVTSGAVLYTAANQPLLVLIEGTFTVTTAGTFALQMCQNTSNASNSVVNIGSYMELTRIA